MGPGPGPRLGALAPPVTGYHGRPGPPVTGYRGRPGPPVTGYHFVPLGGLRIITLVVKSYKRFIGHAMQSVYIAFIFSD